MGDHNTPLLQEPDSFDDLLGVRVPLEDSELPTPDFSWGSYFTPPIANMVETTPTIQQQSGSMSAPMTDIVQSQNTDPAQQQASPHKETPIIKEEPKDIPFTFRIAVNTIDDAIEISDTEDTNPAHKYSARMSHDTISLHESDKDDDDVMVLQPDGSSVPIKKEDDEVEFLWEKMDDRVIELDSDNEPSAAPGLDLGKSFLRGLNPNAKRPTIDRSAVMRAQEAYLRARRRNNGIPEPSEKRGGVLNGPKLPVDSDSSSWMKADYVPDEDNGSSFRALKKSYNAKVKSDSNTLDDDVAFIKAEKAERLRLARLKAEYENARGYSDDDNSDDGLFVSPSLATTSRPKRSAFDDLDAGEENTDSRSAKQRKSNSNGKRSHQGQDQELETNMMAGIEEFVRKTYADKGEKSRRKGDSGKDGSKRKRRSKKTGHLNGSSSLLASNVYEDADANLDREALPISGHTHKQKALAALVASVPLGITPEDAIAQKNRIHKATVVLGRGIRGTCKADGENNWKLTGMNSSLRHHQVLGASFMKERETGGEEPLGGILVSLRPRNDPHIITDLQYLKADAMGMGKTVETIALMISNPPPRGEKHRSTLIVCTPGLLVQCKLLARRFVPHDAADLG